MPIYFIVRAHVQNAADREAFDVWYRDEHLPQALEAFQARRAFRGWNTLDPAVHCAFYEFDTLAAAQAIQQSAGLKELIVEFDRVWGGRVTRTRDLVDVTQIIDG